MEPIYKRILLKISGEALAGEQGFGINRLHILPKGAGAGISRLITMVLIPALLIYNNMTEFQLANIRQYSQLVLMGVFLWAAVTLIMLKRRRANREDTRAMTLGLLSTTMESTYLVMVSSYSMMMESQVQPPGIMGSTFSSRSMGQWIHTGQSALRASAMACSNSAMLVALLETL